MRLSYAVSSRVLRFTRTVVWAVFTLVFARTAQTAVVASHVGDTDPATEGWTVAGPESAGPVEDSGTLAWSIDDNSTAGGSFRSYMIVPPASAETEGWVLRVRTRVVDSSDGVDFAVSAGYGDNQGRRYEMEFGSDSDGDPIVLLQSTSGTIGVGPSFTLEGASSTYHLYELVFDPAAGSADLFVDGVERISGYQGVTDTTTAFVAWGSRQSAATGHGHYNLVEFAVPSPPVATVSPSQSTAAIGSRVASCVHIDVNPTSELLGSYGATLNWDPAVLQFFSVSGGDSPFDMPTVNTADVASGSLVVADADPGGTAGNVFVFCVEFDVIVAGGSSSLLDLDLTSAFSAATFENLLPAVVTDATIDVVLECTVGGVNGDGSINSGDALIILSDDIGLPIPATLENRLNAGCGDANGDGVTNATDANIALAYEVGLSIDPGFPINGSNQTFDDCTTCGGGGASPAAYDPTSVSGETNRGTRLAFESQFLPRDTPSGRSIPLEFHAFPNRVRQGELLQLSVRVDPGAVHKSLGSYSGRLEWDPRALEFVGLMRGSTPGFETPLTNLTAADDGVLRFTGANPQGVEGQVELVRAQFRALGDLKDVEARFRKELTSLAAPSPAFENLLPLVIAPKIDRRPLPLRRRTDDVR